MAKLDKKAKNKQKEQKPEPEFLSIFCFDTISIDEAFRSLVRQFFSKETMTSLREYGEVLRGIHNRLISEGYVINKGEFYKNGVKIN